MKHNGTIGVPVPNTDIKIIKDILDDAKECGCIAGISLSNGQLTHANFSKSKLFDFTADVLYNKKSI